MGKWKQSLARRPTSLCSKEGKFVVITLCLKIVMCLQKGKGVAAPERDSEIGRWRMGRMAIVLHANTLLVCHSCERE